MALAYEIIPVTHFSQNCSIIWCDQTRQAAVVDPGGDSELILRKIAELGVDVKYILLTHGHLDHVGASQALAAQLQAPIFGPAKQDDFWLQALPTQCEMFGFGHVDAFVPTQWLTEQDKIEIGNSQLTVLHTPGHTPGHVIFVSEADRLAWVGDVLFSGSIGRTDFPQGDHATLIHSIKEKMFPLGEDITFVPGHGPVSTFGKEKRTNPYLADPMNFV